MMDLYAVQPDELQDWLPMLMPSFTRMADGSKGCFSAFDVVRSIAARNMQLWLFLDGGDVVCTFVTEIVVMPQLKACRYVGVVGKRWREWIGMGHPEIEKWAKANGCTRMQAVAPKAAYRHMLPDYSVDHILFSRDI